MQNGVSIGVDIGGTHISCAAVHIQEGKLLGHTLSRATYDHEAPAAQILERWATALNSTLDTLPVAPSGIGFAIPGPFDYRNGVSKMEHKFKNLFGLHIPTALQPLLKTTNSALPMRFLNDATSFAVGESWLGEGRGFQRIVVITLGTGFGSAFLEDEVPVVSGNRVPKEGCLWHLPFKTGIADDYFSTRWFVQEYLQKSGHPVQGVKDLMQRADTDTVARNLFLQFGQNLAECLTAPLRNFDAEVLIVGGNIAHALPLFGDAFRAGLNKEGLSLKVVASRHMEHAALIGSARLLDDVFWAKVSEHLPRL